MPQKAISNAAVATTDRQKLIVWRATRFLVGAKDRSQDVNDEWQNHLSSTSELLRKTALP
jgi:hypothetical protein